MSRLLTLFVIIALGACSNSSPGESSFSEEQEIRLLQNLMQEQQQAWNQNDLQGFMKAYWKSEELIFIGSRGITYGWQTTLDNYRQSYNNPEKMGTLHFDNEKIEILQDHSAMVAGKWNLFRSADTLAGSYLLVWKKLDGEWKIIADHSS
mgnify:CR=1 FL=1